MKLCHVLAVPARKGSVGEGGVGGTHTCTPCVLDWPLDQQWPRGVAWEGFDGEGKSMSLNGAGREGKVSPQASSNW